MKPIQLLDRTDGARVQYVCTDIDDTLTRDGRLPSEAYSALWDLHDAGIRVIPVTGRPAGWCDLIARQWPVDAVVGENGALAFYMEDRHLRHLYHPSADREQAAKLLAGLRRRVLSEVAGSRVAKDQFSRMFDLAIDFREEPPDLGFEAAQRIASVCRDMGAQAKISSIHVNAWFGRYTKVDMLEHYLTHRRGLDPATQQRVVVYCGDSPNDEPMFERFELSCGVANITPMLHLIKHQPSYITQGEYGTGFAELADVILSSR
jgi:1,2-diacylglycerol 3-alpha-glucosyltransferase